MNDILLEGKGLHKVYYVGQKQLDVLKGIDLKIARGKIVSFVGPSGAGKSTLLHLLGGLDKPSRGEVLLEGTNIYKLSDDRRAGIRNRQMGFVFQFYHLLSEFTAVENVMLPGLISPSSVKKRNTKYEIRNTKYKNKALLRESAYELLGRVGLKDRVDHKPGELSGGEQQRVAIARALINEPDIIFCDEPTGNLDSQTGEEICALLWKLNKEKKQTLVIVTHEERITGNSDLVIRIQDGKLAGG